MKPAVLIPLALGAMALVGLAVFEIGGVEPASPDDFTAEDPRDDPETERPLPGGISLDMRGRTPKGAGVPPVFAASGGIPGQEDVKPGDARAAFGNALAELDQILADRRRISQAQYEEIYRWANDAYTGYSVHLDAREAEDRDALDDAHAQLLERLGKLKRRVRKKRGGRDPAPSVP